MGKTRNFYASGNTSRGPVHLYEEIFRGLDRLFILKGGPGTGKSALIRRVSEAMTEQGFDAELYHCPSEVGALDGVIFPQLKAGIVDGTPPHVLEPALPGAVDEYVHLAEGWNTGELVRRREELERLYRRMEEAYSRACATYASAYEIHVEREKLYARHLDPAKGEQVTREMEERLFGQVKMGKEGRRTRRFFGAGTPEGPKDFLMELTEGLKKRWFLKGRPGTGKSTLLKKLATVALERGFDVEVYHCGFDPSSVDMVLLPERGVALFDSTPPHEYFPQREGDEVLDMYRRLIDADVDRLYQEDLQRLNAGYSSRMKEATKHLAEAKSIRDELKQIYVEATDYGVVEEKIAYVEETLKSLASAAR